MLQRIRDNASGPVSYAVVALISLVFGVWGIGSYFTDSPNPVVASVGGTDITKYQLQQAYDQRYQRLQQLMGENFKHDMVKPEEFRRDVLEGLIQQAALSQYADSHGYRVTDQELLQKLSSDKRFQVDGKFSTERYRALLAQARMVPGAYEANVRHEMRVDQLRQGLLDTSFVTHREVALDYRLQHQRRDLTWLEFSADTYKDQVKVTDEQIAAYYNKHKQDYLTPERVKLAYVDLERSNLTPAKKPETKFLKALYDQEKDTRFKTPERREARHILVRIDDKTDADAARVKIQKLAQELKNGAKFSKLAEEQSDDDSTAKKGGQLDWVSRGTMVAAFEQALFALKPGQVSKPVRTDFGWHLIKLEAVEPAKEKPFDDPEVQTELLNTYRSQERDERYKQMTERLDNLSFEAPESLKLLADDLKLKIQTTDWLTRDGVEATGLGKYQKVRDAAFTDSVLKDKLNSTPIQLGGDRQVVIRIAKREAAEQQPLEDVKSEIRTQLRDKAAAEKARDAAQVALKAVQSGKALNSVAEETKAQTNTSGWVTRDDKKVNSAVLDEVFALPHPQDDKPSTGLATLSDGGVAVVVLSAVDQPKSTDKNNVDKEKIADEARGRVAGLEYGAFRQALRSDISVKVDEDKLN